MAFGFSVQSSSDHYYFEREIKQLFTQLHHFLPLASSSSFLKLNLISKKLTSTGNGINPKKWQTLILVPTVAPLRPIKMLIKLGFR